jgi:predicted nucleotidyltransferase component of viral defense system
MAFSELYRQQATLLVRVLPFIAEESVFGLKGGTAINLFRRDMPRLSVDIDLTYLPIKARDESLAAIDDALKRIEGRIAKTIPSAKITPVSRENNDVKFWVRVAKPQILIEVNTVIRGAVFGAEMLPVSPRVEDELGFAEMQVLSKADLYGGKFVAALDRQHPRDFFDVRELLADDGIDDAMRRAFIVYLLSHNRPMWEVLTVRRKDFSEEFIRGFEGMTEHPVKKRDLEEAREELIKDIIGKMPSDHRSFLISFEKGEPNWKLLNVDGAAKMPAVLWRQRNLGLLSEERRQALVKSLSEVLDAKP